MVHVNGKHRYCLYEENKGGHLEMKRAMLICAYSLSVFPTGFTFICGVDPANSIGFINRIMTPQICTFTCSYIQYFYIIISEILQNQWLNCRDMDIYLQL